MADFPNSYKDPLYADLDAKTEAKLGLPVGLLSSVRTRGERSNHDQTNELNTASVYQFTPSTAKLIEKKYGINPLLNPANASEAAGLLLKEGLDRNKGDAALSVAEYVGGTDRKAWGPITRNYVNRVMSGQTQAKNTALENDFAKFMAENPAIPAGRSASAAAPAAPAPAADTAALESGFAQYLEANPPAPPAPEPKEMNFLERTRESITGTERRTPETDALPDWAGMPELNQLSLASAKTGLGTLLSSPAETVQIIRANFPNVQVRQDAKGNYLLKSAADGQEYAIKPGFQVSDIPRAGAAIAAFTPAGRATTLGGAALGSAATQAVIEGTQAATGGTFDPKEVAIAGVAGAAVPAVARVASAGTTMAKDALQRVRGAPEPIVNPAAVAREAAAVAPERPLPGGFDEVLTPSRPTIVVNPSGDARVPGAAPVEPVAPVAPAAPAVAPMAASDLAQTAKKAAEGGMGSSRATQVLAEQAAPDAATVAAAKRLGIEDHLQPDHVTTNQAYREFAQAVKSYPGSEARAAELAGMENVAKRADDLIGEIGGTTDASTLSSSVKTRMQATQTALEQQAKDLYAKVRDVIPAKTPSPATETLNFLAKHADEMGGATKLSAVERGLLGDLKTTPTYAFLDKTRQDIGQAMERGSGKFKDSGTGLLKKLYSTLSTDQAAIAEQAGAGALYSAAKASVAVRKGLEDDLVSLFGKNLDASLTGPLSGAVRALPQGDAAKLVKLVSSVPNEMKQQVVASGIASAFRTAGTRGPINFTTYAKWYEGLLRNKQAYNAIMTNLPPAARKQLSDLYRVSKGISAASRERITTGRIQAVMDEFKGPDNLAGRLYQFVTRHIVTAGAGTAAGFVGGPGIGAAVASALSKGAKPNAIKAADALIASPEFAQLARQGGNQAAKVRQFAYSKPFTRYVRAVGSPRSMENREKWVLQVLQGRNNNQD